MFSCSCVRSHLHSAITQPYTHTQLTQQYSEWGLCVCGQDPMEGHLGLCTEHRLPLITSTGLCKTNQRMCWAVVSTVIGCFYFLVWIKMGGWLRSGILFSYFAVVVFFFLRAQIILLRLWVGESVITSLHWAELRFRVPLSRWSAISSAMKVLRSTSWRPFRRRLGAELALRCVGEPGAPERILILAMAPLRPSTHTGRKTNMKYKYMHFTN